MAEAKADAMDIVQDDEEKRQREETNNEEDTRSSSTTVADEDYGESRHPGVSWADIVEGDNTNNNNNNNNNGVRPPPESTTRKARTFTFFNLMSHVDISDIVIETLASYFSKAPQQVVEKIQRDSRYHSR